MSSLQNEVKILRSRTDVKTEKIEKSYNIVIAVTGSVATIKLVELINLLKEKFSIYQNDKISSKILRTELKIRIVMTENSKHFMPKRKLVNMLADMKIEIFDDADEWNTWKKMSDPVLHIELRKWADICLIAPLDANTMAKLANGICDNLLTCLVRAWDTSKPLVYCPAMNVHMYNHPITKEQLCRLQSFGYLRVDAIEKVLACGDFGMGAMASLETIVNKVTECLLNPISSRRPSLPKPILNQQPTYPIISRTEDKNSINSNFKLNSNGLSLLNNIRAGSTLSIQSVPNIVIKNHRMNSNLSPKSNDFIFRQGSSTKRTNSYNLKNSNNYRICTPISRYPRNGRSAGCTSLQNLNAATGTEFNSLIDNNLPISSEDDEEYDDFDPSRLLEQSMVVEDDVNAYNTQQKFDHIELNNEFINEIDDSVQTRIVKDLRVNKLLNTTKFLDLCYVEDRKVYTCSICHHDYQSRKSMARHLKEQHVQGNIYDCEPCGVSYKRKEQLIRHIKKHHKATN